MTVQDLIRRYTELREFNILVTDRGEVSQTYADVRRLSDEFAEAVAAIRGDKRLSTVGKDEAIEKLARDTRTAVDEWHTAEQQRFDDYLAHLSDKLEEAVSPRGSDDANQSNLRREVRDAARGLDDLQREQLYRQGDATVRRALEELPAITGTKDGGILIKPFIGDELRQEVLLEAGRAALPATATAIDKTRAAEGRFLILAGALRNEISKEVPAFASDAVKPEITIA